MSKSFEARLSNFVFLISCFLIIYMPLHVFIVQSVSLLTGGLEVWKAAKDVLVFLLLPFLIYEAVRRELFKDKIFRWLVILGASYGLLHGIFLLFHRGTDLTSTIIACSYNTRILIYLFLGYLLGTSHNAKKYSKFLLTTVVIIASLVALFGVMQYFLPKDMLTHVGYTLERGVKPMFFIDDKPDLPRVMSTLKDPNSLGAYLILPILITAYALLKKRVNDNLFTRPFRRGTLCVMLGLQILALFLTFSRGALLALIISTVTILSIVTGERVWIFIKKHWIYFVVLIFIIPYSLFIFRNTYVFQNLVFHADQSTVLEDPNELRVSLTKQAINEIEKQPLGHGPGTAGLVAIRNPQKGMLTENYYLQIAHEVGIIGLIIFVAILCIVTVRLFNLARGGDEISQTVFSAMIAYSFYALLIHLWSNEAVAYQFWLLSGLGLISIGRKKI